MEITFCWNNRSNILYLSVYLQSGKLVLKMFTKRQEYIEDPEAVVCVLICEVESLTSAWQSAMAGTAPSNSLRVVDVVLTQIVHI